MDSEFWAKVDAATKYVANRFIEHGGKKFEADVLIKEFNLQKTNDPVLLTLIQLKRLNNVNNKTAIADSTPVAAAPQSVIDAREIDHPDVVNRVTNYARKHKIISGLLIAVIVANQILSLANGIKRLWPEPTIEIPQIQMIDR